MNEIIIIEGATLYLWYCMFPAFTETCDKCLFDIKFPFLSQYNTDNNFVMAAGKKVKYMIN